VDCSTEQATLSDVILHTAAPNTPLSPGKRDLSVPPPLYLVAESNTGYVDVAPDHTIWPIVLNYDGVPSSIEFTQDASLLAALPSWSNAEIIQDWDMQWEKNLGFTDLPEELELVYRPASAYTNQVIQTASEEPQILRLLGTTLECCEAATDITQLNPIMHVYDENNAHPIPSTPEHKHRKLLEALSQLKLTIHTNQLNAEEADQQEMLLRQARRVSASVTMEHCLDEVVHLLCKGRDILNHQ